MTRAIIAYSAFLLFLIGCNAAAARDDMLAQAQLLLLTLGYEPGPVDGAMGGRTRQALEDFLTERGGVFDGEVDANEFDEIYAALGDVRFNGQSPLASAADGRTSYSSAYDFVPARDLAADFVPLDRLAPNALYDAIRGTRAARRYCRYNPLDGFPSAENRLHTYASEREFNTTAERNPHPDNRWIEDVAFAVQRAGGGVAVSQDPAAVKDLKAALLSYAEAGTALDSSNLVDSSGQVIVVPDFATGNIAATALLANYVLARPGLDLQEDEQAKIEKWLDRMFETFPDSHFVATGQGSLRDVFGIERVGRAMMFHALMRDDVEEFNEGAKLVLTALSFVREDGSDRLGASRGNRALYYQGSVLMHAMEDYILFQSQGLDAEALLGDTVRRLADFWGRAWDDNSVLFPYARENNAVYSGSNYQEQEIKDPSFGLDPFLAIGSDEPIANSLFAARASYQYETIFGSSFNETCVAFVLDPNFSPVFPGSM